MSRALLARLADFIEVRCPPLRSSFKLGPAASIARVRRNKQPDIAVEWVLGNALALLQCLSIEVLRLRQALIGGNLYKARRLRRIVLRDSAAPGSKSRRVILIGCET